MQTFVIILAAGALAWGTNSLEYTRKYHELPKGDTICNIGVHSRYATTIGRHALFFDLETEAIYGPFLISDVQASEYAGQMETNGLAADIDCKELYTGPACCL